MVCGSNNEKPEDTLRRLLINTVTYGDWCAEGFGGYFLLHVRSVYDFFAGECWRSPLNPLILNSSHGYKHIFTIQS